ncbi:MAG: tRNA 2-thiouridine(34) synthase MnmA [bacterium]|nr:tRNA 2-thiouridine(34) synthase MnmA [bacterium]
MKIAVLVSGGVDSSVALNLLKREGHDVGAFYLKVWLEDELAFLGECPWEEDLKYVRRVCDQLDVPLEIVSLQAEYLDRVVSYALAELRVGRTPSPDIFCNQRIKFGAFFDHIDDTFERVATGHYAQVGHQGALVQLKRAPDPVKDQTYFLSGMFQDQVARALFPIGHYLKNEVRDLARAFDLPTQARKDSQGICFLGKIRYPEFIKFHLGEQEGEIVELETGTVLGTHQGYWYYTIGQRQGLGLGQGPWYVMDKNTDKNIIYVSHQLNQAARSRDELVVAEPNWIAGPPETHALQLKLRHGPSMVACTIRSLDNNRLAVHMAEKDTGVAPGQFAVFYDGEVCLGHAVIAS